MDVKPNFTVMKTQVKNFVSRIQCEKLKTVFTNCFYNTLDTTTEFWPDDTTYIFTGDIDAMWLRDSSAQVMQYLEFSDDEDVRRLIKGLINRQSAYIVNDPYANAFGKHVEGEWISDECEKHPYVWERKFELDSLCYPIWLAENYYKKTSDASVFSAEFLKAFDVILKVFVVEQQHGRKSTYYHYRPTEDPSFSVPGRGHGGKVKECGFIWSGYRPSDDPQEYGYFVPGNMFVRVVLSEILKIGELNFSTLQRKTVETLVSDIDCAVSQYAVVDGTYGKMYAYEVDGLGGIKLMDDANVPSLLSLPYLGYVSANNELYRATRAFVLSESNPYYYSGSCISGVGSPHTPLGYVWHISLMMQGLTSDDADEVNGVLDTLLATDAGTKLMHEGVYKDDASKFTRSWFAWANSLFSLFVLKKADLIKYIDRG